MCLVFRYARPSASHLVGWNGKWNPTDSQLSDSNLLFTCSILMQLAIMVGVPENVKSFECLSVKPISTTTVVYD